MDGMSSLVSRKARILSCLVLGVKEWTGAETSGYSCSEALGITVKENLGRTDKLLLQGMEQAQTVSMP